MRAYIKENAPRLLLGTGKEQVHLDDLYDVDECIEIRKGSGFYINLEKSSKPGNLKFNNGYKPIPINIIKNFKKLQEKNR